MAISRVLIKRMMTKSLPKLNFKQSPTEIVSSVKNAIEYGKVQMDVIGNIQNPTFKSAMEALAALETLTSMNVSVARFIQYVSDDSHVREASVQASKMMDDYDVEIGMHEKVFQVASKVRELNENLEPEQKRFLDKVLLGFKRNGLELDEQSREKLKSLRKKLAELETDYNRNMNEESSYLLFDEAELEGCSGDFLASLEQKTEEGKTKYILTMKYPDVYGVLRYAKNPEVRKKMDIAFNSRCKDENLPLIKEAIQLRHECAKLLGYESHSGFQLEERLAKSPAKVNEFEDDLRAKLMPLGLKDLERLMDYKRDEVGQSDVELMSWDVPYYSRILLEREYSIDQEKIKEYFSLETVVGEMLRIYEEVLGLKFTVLEGAEAWHPDVQTIQVEDAASGELLGHFYLDLFPRAGKYSHAACFPLQPGFLMPDGNRQTSANAIVANFSKPLPSKPSLLKLDEVRTLFHELGHSMHGLCARTRYARFHGTNVETDFVEAPSQMLENWIYNHAILKRLSKHYISGESIPEELIEKIVISRHVNAGLSYLRQVFFGVLDMTLHTGDQEGKDINQIYEQLKKEISLIPQPPNVYPLASFGHLMGGYDAGYYGYLWSEVFSADMFWSRFNKEGLQNQTTGLSYRHSILQPGGSRDGMVSLKEFLGREPNSKAFVKSIGL